MDGANGIITSQSLGHNHKVLLYDPFQQQFNGPNLWLRIHFFDVYPVNKFTFLDIKPLHITWILNCCCAIAIAVFPTIVWIGECKSEFFYDFRSHNKIWIFENILFHSSLIFMCRWNLWIVFNIYCCCCYVFAFDTSIPYIQSSLWSRRFWIRNIRLLVILVLFFSISLILQLHKSLCITFGTLSSSFVALHPVHIHFNLF